MNKLDKDYQLLLKDILENGNVKKDRTGTGTISVFGRQIRHKMSDGFPLLTTKKMYTKGIITELIWFLRGDTNIKYLVDNNCNIWNGDAYKKYTEATKGNDSTNNQWMRDNGDNTLSMYTMEEFVEKIKTDDEFMKVWGELGPTYGKQWRQWQGWVEHYSDGKKHLVSIWFDQILELINNLKNNPDSRRLMVTAWNVAEVDKMTLPPCHYGFQCYTRELTNDEIVNYYYKNIDPNTKWKKDDRGRYFYLGKSLSESENIWCEHSTGDIIFGMKPSCPSRALSLKWQQRSVDTFLGLPFNIASYGLLLSILANECNMIPDELIGDLGDTHLYLNHIEQAKEQIGREMTTEERNEWFIKNWCGGNRRDSKDDWKDYELDQQNVPKMTREPFELPELKINIKPSFNSYYDFKPEKWSPNDFEILNYKSHSVIKADLSN